MIAYIVIARQDNIIQELLDEVFQRNSVTKGRIYHFGKEKAQLPIEEVRRIKLLATSQFSQPTAFVLWHLDRATEAVQNTLLKIIEEHPDNLLFLFPVSSEAPLISTIVSRARVISRHHAPDPHTLSLAHSTQWDTLITPSPTTPLASHLLSCENKKVEHIVPLIEEFLRYGYQSLKSTRYPSTLPLLLLQAYRALKVIKDQNMDPELALNTIFM